MTLTTEEMLRKAGGKRIQKGTGDHWDFGWRATEPETWEELYASGLARDSDPNEDVPEIKGDTVELYHEVKQAFGSYMYSWQMIGSCVEAGGQNGVITRQAQEIIHAARHEGAELPFCWLAYAAARSDGSNNRSEGDGASGTLFAKYLNEIGIPSNNTPGLPKPQLIPVEGRDDAYAIVYSPATLDQIAQFDPDRMQPRIVAQYELQFSTMKNIKQEWVEAAKKHTIKIVRCNSAEDVKRELRRRRPILAAGDWGGLLQCPMVDGVLLNRRAGSWSHQQSINAWRNHPTLGEIFRWQNQWYFLRKQKAVSMHGVCPPDEPPGGYWTRASDVDYQARTGEVFAIHGLEGYTEGAVDWTKGA